eukprot:TRINITY_DN12597_c0_g1_i1.p1 TRINITY_DN12597_c0_g1~~TRINITY_DN12597_c0_g1_i1.p1  ORF type:complete len:150 (+),score=20.05 TRINITY_DN12597_c0_g1_i1:124-573(+)
MQRTTLIAIALMIGTSIACQDILCNPNQFCCNDPEFGPRCYDGLQYDCPMNDRGVSKVCPKGQKVCGEVCFDPKNWCCSSNGTIALVSECNNCAGQVFDPNTHSCTTNELGKDVLCPKNHRSCGVACYDAAQGLCCKRGKIHNCRKTQI